MLGLGDLSHISILKPPKKLPTGNYPQINERGNYHLWRKDTCHFVKSGLSEVSTLSNLSFIHCSHDQTFCHLFHSQRRSVHVSCSSHLHLCQTSPLLNFVHNHFDHSSTSVICFALYSSSSGSPHLKQKLIKCQDQTATCRENLIQED